MTYQAAAILRTKPATWLIKQKRRKGEWEKGKIDRFWVHHSNVNQSILKVVQSSNLKEPINPFLLFKLASTVISIIWNLKYPNQYTEKILKFTSIWIGLNYNTNVKYTSNCIYIYMCVCICDKYVIKFHNNLFL